MGNMSLGRMVLALTVALCSTGARGESTGWLSLEELKAANNVFINKWYIPTDFAVRIRNGHPEYRVNWQKNQGHPFGFAVYPTTSRAMAEAAIETHRDPPNLLGGPDKLCLAKFATTKSGDKEYYLLYLTEHEASGLRCIRLPVN